MKRIKGYLLGLMGLGIISLPGIALDANAYSGGQHRGPPPEAISACEGSAENQACQFEAPHGTVVGTCLNIREQLACAPEGGPRQPPRDSTPGEV